MSPTLGAAWSKRVASARPAAWGTSLTLVVLSRLDGSAWSLPLMVATTVWAAGLLTRAVILRVAVPPSARDGTVQTPVVPS